MNWRKGFCTVLIVTAEAHRDPRAENEDRRARLAAAEECPDNEDWMGPYGFTCASIRAAVLGPVRPCEAMLDFFGSDYPLEKLVENCPGTCDSCAADSTADARCTDAYDSDWAGDGYCNSENNVDPCYDGGDCCESTCISADYTCGDDPYAPYDCKDPSAGSTA